MATGFELTDGHFPHSGKELTLDGASAESTGLNIDYYYPQLPALAALLSGLFVGVFAGLLPARSAARKDIVEAVQYA